MKFVEFALGLTMGSLLLAAQEGVLVRAAATPTPSIQHVNNRQVSYSSSPSSSSSSVRPEHPLGGKSIVIGMPVAPSDLDISYNPELAWITRSSQQDSSSCLAGTKSSSTPGSYLEYKFTGSGIQLYTAASATAGSFTVALDGSPYGSFSISKEEGQEEPCAARLIVDINSLPATQHTLRVTVTEGPTDDGGLNFVFAGFGLSSISSNSSRLANTSVHPTPAPKQNVGAIVGTVVGSLASVGLIALCLFFFLRKRRIAATTQPVSSISNGALTFGPSKAVEDDQQTLCGVEPDKQMASKV